MNPNTKLRLLNENPLEKNLQDALAQGNQQEAEEARKILAKETLKLEEKPIRKGKNPQIVLTSLHSSETLQDDSIRSRMNCFGC